MHSESSIYEMAYFELLVRFAFIYLFKFLALQPGMITGCFCGEGGASPLCYQWAAISQLGDVLCL